MSITIDPTHHIGVASRRMSLRELALALPGYHIVRVRYVCQATFFEVRP